MKTIHKYKLKITTFQTVLLPQNYKILHLGVQNGVPTIWCECFDDSPLVKLDIYCVGTGFNMDKLPPIRHIGTIQIDSFVWHYYQVIHNKPIVKVHV